VSIRHDPYDAIEETLLDESIDEFIIAIAPHGLSRQLHLDLPHGLPISSCPSQQSPEEPDARRSHHELP
jgi:hypothetical protein